MGFNAVNDLISDAYRQLNADLHDSNKLYGRSGTLYAATIAQLCAQCGARTVLDYGCGKGTLKLSLNQGAPTLIVHEYDPAILGKDAPPQAADFVACTDVAEHIEPEKIDSVLAHIASLTRIAGFMTIDTAPAEKVLADGRNAHLLIRPKEWWEQKLSEHFTVNRTMLQERTVIALLLPKATARG